MSQLSPGASRTGHFRRSEHAMSHIVYGLILAVATLGELIRHEADALEAAAGLFLVAVVLLAAHLFSDVVARMISEDDEVRFGGMVRIGRSDLAVTLGGVTMGGAMLVAHLLDAAPSNAMTACLIGALGWLAVQTFSALHRHGTAVRLVMSVAAVLLAGLIVALENLH